MSSSSAVTRVFTRASDSSARSASQVDADRAGRRAAAKFSDPQDQRLGLVHLFGGGVQRCGRAASRTIATSADRLSDSSGRSRPSRRATRARSARAVGSAAGSNPFSDCATASAAGGRRDVLAATAGAGRAPRILEPPERADRGIPDRRVVRLGRAASGRRRRPMPSRRSGPRSAALAGARRRLARTVRCERPRQKQ